MVEDLVALAQANPWWPGAAMVAVLIRARYQGRTASDGIMAIRAILESPYRPAKIQVSFGQYRGAALAVSATELGGSHQDEKGGEIDNARLGFMPDESSDQEYVKFYGDTFPWILSRVQAQTGADRATAEDAVQEAFIACREHLLELRCRDNQATWRKYLTTAAVNKVTDHRRKNKVVYGWDPLASVDAPTMSTGDHAPEVAERLAALQCLMRLPERQRAALIAVIYLDQTLEEAAKLLGVSPSTIRVHVERAKRRLKRDLNAAAAARTGSSARRRRKL